MRWLLPLVDRLSASDTQPNQLLSSNGAQSLVDTTPIPQTVDETQVLLASGDYLADRGLATAVFLAMRLSRPLLLEGEAGVGKTEIAKVLATTLGRQLIRLQCYEGLDISSSVYEWNYARQMIEIRLAEAHGIAQQQLNVDVFDQRFLLERPLLQALRPHVGGPPVLLIDELDRADEPFEAYLLELLSEFQVTIPEIGVIRAEQAPLVIVTSNRTREIHDALKRRCLYHWVEYPDLERELAIVHLKVPGLGEKLTREVVSFTQQLRGLDLFKRPGVAETIDWARALIALAVDELSAPVVEESLGAVLKYQDDMAAVRGSTLAAMLEHVASGDSAAKVCL